MTALILRTLIVAAAIVMPRDAAATGAPEIPLALPILVYADIDPASLDLAKRSTMEHLRVAGIQVDWRHCHMSGAACRLEDAARGVLVRVVTIDATTRHVCGGATPESVDGDVIMVYLPCHQDAIRTIRTKPVAQSEPRLATLQVGHLLGLTLAHEIGHVLGLPHGGTGVMQSRFDIVDFLELRSSRLTFTSRERARMRQAMVARAKRGLAEATIWH